MYYAFVMCKFENWVAVDPLKLPLDPKDKLFRQSKGSSTNMLDPLDLEVTANPDQDPSKVCYFAGFRYFDIHY